MNKFSVGTIIGTALLPLLKRRGASNVFKKENCLRLSFQDRFIWLDNFQLPDNLENKLRNKTISGPIEDLIENNTKNHYDDTLIKLQESIQTIQSRIRFPWMTPEAIEKEITPVRLKINKYRGLSEYYNKGKIEAQRSVYSWDIQIGEFEESDTWEGISTTRISFYAGVLLKPNVLLDWKENKESRIKLDQMACYLSSIVNNKVFSILTKNIFPFSSSHAQSELAPNDIDKDQVESSYWFHYWLDSEILSDLMDQYTHDPDDMRFTAWGDYQLYIDEVKKFFEYNNDEQLVESELPPSELKLRQR